MHPAGPRCSSLAYARLPNESACLMFSLKNRHGVSFSRGAGSCGEPVVATSVFAGADTATSPGRAATATVGNGTPAGA